MKEETLAMVQMFAAMASMGSGLEEPPVKQERPVYKAQMTKKQIKARAANKIARKARKLNH